MSQFLTPQLTFYMLQAVVKVLWGSLLIIHGNVWKPADKHTCHDEQGKDHIPCYFSFPYKIILHWIINMHSDIKFSVTVKPKGPCFKQKTLPTECKQRPAKSS
jgi:hypothetical protein